MRPGGIVPKYRAAVNFLLSILDTRRASIWSMSLMVWSGVGAIPIILDTGLFTY
jgi:hypothetical protein